MPGVNNSSPFNIQRNGVQDKNWKLFRADGQSEFEAFGGFCCGDDDLNDFIINDAFAHKTQLIAETYVLKEATKGYPVAFISFCNDSIPLAKLAKNTKKTLPTPKRYGDMPAVKIARLGVRKDLQGNNIGTHIINMTKEFFTYDNRTGCRFLTVDSYNNEKTLNFYKKNDFQPLKKQDTNKQTVIMYLDLKRLK